MTDEDMEDVNFQIKYSLDMRDITLTVSVHDDQEPISPEQYKKILEFFANRAEMEDVFAEDSVGEGISQAH